MHYILKHTQTLIKFSKKLFNLDIYGSFKTNNGPRVANYLPAERWYHFILYIVGHSSLSNSEEHICNTESIRI